MTYRITVPKEVVLFTDVETNTIREALELIKDRAVEWEWMEDHQIVDVDPTTALHDVGVTGFTTAERNRKLRKEADKIWSEMGGSISQQR